MHGIPYDQQKLLEETYVLETCPRCKREVYEVEVETGLCLMCVGKEEEC